VAPEETRGAELIDEVTNVYTMGATAFMLPTNHTHNPDDWPLNPESHAVITKAVSNHPRPTDWRVGGARPICRRVGRPAPAQYEIMGATVRTSPGRDRAARSTQQENVRAGL